MQWAERVVGPVRESLQEEDSGRPVPNVPGWQFKWIYPSWWLEYENGALVPFSKSSHGAGQGINPIEYSLYLDTSGLLELPERRFRPNATFSHSWQFDLEALRSRGWIVSDWPFEMTKRGRLVASALDEFTREMEHRLSNSTPESQHTAAWMAAWMGDMPLAAHLSYRDFPELSNQLAVLAENQIRNRAADIQKQLPLDDRSIFVKRARLESLACLGRFHAMHTVHEVFLRNSREEGCLDALSIIEAWAVREDIPMLVQGLSQAEPKMEQAYPESLLPDTFFPDEIPLRIIIALLKICEPSTLPQHARELMLSRLHHEVFSGYPLAAALLYLFDKTTGLSQLERAMKEPSLRLHAACYLAIISTTEAIALLIEQAKASEGGVMDACVLSYVPDAGAQRLAQEWSAHVGHLPDPLDTNLCSSQQLDWYFGSKMAEGRFADLEAGYRPLLRRWCS